MAMKHYNTNADRDIYEAAEGSVKEANRLGQTVHFNFNGVDLSVSPSSRPGDIVTLFNTSFEVNKLRSELKEATTERRRGREGQFDERIAVALETLASCVYKMAPEYAEKSGYEGCFEIVAEISNA